MIGLYQSQYIDVTTSRECSECNQILEKNKGGMQYHKLEKHHPNFCNTPHVHNLVFSDDIDHYVNCLLQEHSMGDVHYQEIVQAAHQFRRMPGEYAISYGNCNHAVSHKPLAKQELEVLRDTKRPLPEDLLISWLKDIHNSWFHAF